MTAHARELREAFDRGFAEAISPQSWSHSDLLCIAVGGEPYAIRIGDIASLHAGLRIVALPSRAPELLGVAAIRANVVPIYDLATALGLPGGAPPRWMVLHRAAQAGFAFEHYDGHVRIADRSTSVTSRRGHIVGQVPVDGRPRLVIDLDSVLTAIETRRNQSHPARKQ